MKKQYKRILSFCLVLILLFTTAACSASKPAKVMKVGVMPDFDSIPLVVAKQQGFLPKNIELVVFMSPLDRNSALFGGELDGTISDVLAVCQAKDGGFDVAITSKTDGCYGLLTTEPISSVKELEGKQIGMSLNTIIEYVTDRIVAGGGGDPKLLKKVSVPNIPSRLELLRNKQIDAITVPEPYVTAAAAQKAHLVSTSTALGINPGILLFKRTAVNEKADDIRAMYKAYNLAVDYIHKNKPSDFMPGVIKELGLPEEAKNASLPDYTHAVMPSEGEVKAAMDWLRSKDMLKKEYTYGELIWKW